MFVLSFNNSATCFETGLEWYGTCELGTTSSGSPPMPSTPKGSFSTSSGSSRYTLALRWNSSSSSSPTSTRGRIPAKPPSRSSISGMSPPGFGVLLLFTLFPSWSGHVAASTSARKFLASAFAAIGDRTLSAASSPIKLEKESVISMLFSFSLAVSPRPRPISVMFCKLVPSFALSSFLWESSSTLFSSSFSAAGKSITLSASLAATSLPAVVSAS